MFECGWIPGWWNRCPSSERYEDRTLLGQKMVVFVVLVITGIRNIMWHAKAACAHNTGRKLSGGMPSWHAGLDTGTPNKAVFSSQRFHSRVVKWTIVKREVRGSIPSKAGFRTFWTLDQLKNSTTEKKRSKMPQWQKRYFKGSSHFKQRKVEKRFLRHWIRQEKKVLRHFSGQTDF